MTKSEKKEQEKEKSLPEDKSETQKNDQKEKRLILIFQNTHQFKKPEEKPFFWLFKCVEVSHRIHHLAPVSCCESF